MPLNRVLYLATGENYISQAVLSLISLVNVYRHSKPNFRVVVLTDNGGPFEWLKQHLDIEVRAVDRDWIEETRGPKKFALRTKLIAIRDTLYEDLANVLFVDTDTIHLRKIDVLFDKLEQGLCFLHKKEWPLSKGRLKHPELCPRDLEFTLASGTRIHIDGNTEMWNSGVVGIPATNGALLRDALELCDRYYEVFPGWHVEQFSLSIILQATGKLRSCRRDIFHYWHNKELAKNTILKHQDIFCSSPTDSVLDRSVGKKIHKFIFQARLKYYIHKIRVLTRKHFFFYKIYCLATRKKY
jgi:hypothetical protein